jgi:YVTN family beta-propeller protein
MLALVLLAAACAESTRQPIPSVSPSSSAEATVAAVSFKTIPLPANGGGMVPVGDILWVAVDGGAVRVDPGSGEVSDIITGIINLAFDGDYLWAGGEGQLQRLDPVTGAGVRRFALEYDAAYIAADTTAVWASDTGASVVHRIDPADGHTVASIEVPSTPKGTVLGEGSVWVACDGAATVVRIDPATNTIVAEIEVGNGPHTIAIGGGFVWVTNRHSQTLSKIDPATNEVIATVPDVAPNVAVGVTVGQGIVYVAYERGVALVDPQSAVVTGHFEVPDAELFYDLKVLNDVLWATEGFGTTLYGFDLSPR